MLTRQQRAEAIEQIVRLRQAERLTDRPIRGEIASAREFLEDAVGPTVRLAEAARLLGIRQPSLQRWIEKGDVSAILTPEGRREVPLSELVGLLEEVNRTRVAGVSRPLSRVIRERKRRSADVDVDRLLPRRRPRTHRTAELQSLAYHRLVAERLDDRMVDDARRRVHRWREDGRIHPRWAEKWEQVLALPLPKITKTIGADTVGARELRQTSPFAGALTQQERRRLVQAVEDRA